MHTVIKYEKKSQALHKNSKGHILICFQYQCVVTANVVINFRQRIFKLFRTSEGHLVQHLALNNVNF